MKPPAAATMLPGSAGYEIRQVTPRRCVTLSLDSRRRGELIQPLRMTAGHGPARLNNNS